MSKLKKYSTLNQLKFNFEEPPDLTNLFQDIKEIASKAIADCSSLSRYDIAAKISQITGIDVTKTILDTWTAESKIHRFPAFAVPAFCIATSNFDLIRVLCHACGGQFVESEDAIYLEIARVEKELNHLEGKKKKLATLLPTKKKR